MFNFQKEIAELSLDLSNKLAFLGITTAELTKFQIMLVEKEVRNTSDFARSSNLIFFFSYGCASTVYVFLNE